jgi:hypothetical protein
MASQERFELPTHALEGRCSIQLSYWDKMERVMRIELTTSAWKAEVLPLNYTRMNQYCLSATFIIILILIVEVNTFPKKYCCKEELLFTTYMYDRDHLVLHALDCKIPHLLCCCIPLQYSRLVPFFPVVGEYYLD